ncbi:MAG: hypothetical protein RIR62_1410, partial [Pseudomonadota bacterium]
ALVAALARAAGRPQAIIAMSGDPSRGQAALACGADGFLAKPVLRIEDLTRAVLHHLPQPTAHLRPVTAPLAYDPLALGDDLTVVSELLEDEPDAELRSYLAGFLAGIARQSGDGVLLGAAEDFARGAETGLLARLVADRRAALPPF